MAPVQLTHWLVVQGRALGFDLCGVAAVEDFAELEYLPEWLARGYAGEMNYLGDPRRRSPRKVLEGARSLIVCALNYNSALPYSTEVPSEACSDSDEQSERGARGWLSRYAWGDDYHQVLLGRLEALVTTMREQIAEPFEARAYVDTGPVLERVAAKYAGLGWLGKNTCLIHPQLGSWLFLGVIVTTLELAPSLGATETPLPDLCGNCRLCIEACPTVAIVEPYVLDARRCISYLTIELRGAIPEELRTAIGRHVFGCDICQDVCPWNRAAPTTPLAEFQPRKISATREARTAPPDIRSPAAIANKEQTGRSLFVPELEWMVSLSEEEFREVFCGSAIRRAKWRGLVRNACVASGNSALRHGTAAHARIVTKLERLAGSSDAVIAEHARWALARLRA